MANYTLKEFKRLAMSPYTINLNDPINHLRLRLDLLYPPIGSPDRTFLKGPGRDGGCYVYICENCGFADYTRDHHQQFCCSDCKKEFYANGKVSQLNTILPRNHTPLHRRCTYCNKTFSVKISNIILGKGLYCSKWCANHSRGFKSLWYRCNTCGMLFKAAAPSKSYFCSIECEEKFTGEKDKIKYNLAIVDHIEEHLVNRNLEYALNFMRRKGISEDKIRITPRLRMQMDNKNNNRYSLEGKRRKTKEDKDVINLINLIGCERIFSEEYLINPPPDDYIEPEPWKTEKDTTWIDRPRKRKNQ